MKKVELLAPAGNMESLKAAVYGGADAVYLGLKTFSARAFAGNFSHEEFQEAVAFCHDCDVKVYVTINTMLFETEIEKAEEEVDFLYHNDCDGILVQDMGLFDYIHKCYPDFDIHCSTQMHIHNLDGVRLMQKLGAKRVVLARETPIEIIKEACKTNMEIEVFAYGAICISYSGQCLMSASIKNRSANRGMCAQCCRLKYYPKEGKHFKEGDYILSPKDLNVIEHLPELIEAGVSSLKIEGRMKRPEYVWLVTRTFREAIDAYYNHETYHVSQKRNKELLLMFNRGFSDGHMFHADVQHRMSQYRPNHQGIEIGKVLHYHNGMVEVKLTDTLYQHDGLRIINEPHDTGLTAVKIYDQKNKLINEAHAGDVVTLECHSKPSPKPGQSLRKTSDARLLESIREKTEIPIKKVSLSCAYTAQIGKPFTVTYQDDRGNTVSLSSHEVCQKASSSPVNDERIHKALEKTDVYPYVVDSFIGHADNIFIPISQLNEIRRNALSRLHEKRMHTHLRLGKQEYYSDIREEKPVFDRLLIQSDTETECHGISSMSEGYGSDHFLPVIHQNMNDTKEIHHAVIGSVNDLYHDVSHCLAGMTCNIANSYAAAFYLEHGCDGVILSSEMNGVQIQETQQAFCDRYHFHLYAYKLVYGHRTLMYIKDGFYADHTLRKMQDLHGNVYPVCYKDDVTEILEPHPYVSENPDCYGSYVILHDEKNQKEILEEAYEELFK